MKASNILIEKIKEFEGFKGVAYKAMPTEKYLTIGYGHYGSNVKKGMKITKDAATELLKKDLAPIERYLSGMEGIDNQYKFDACVDFCFNLGMGNFNGSTLWKKIKAHASDEEIKKEFMRWVYGGGKKLPGLVKRREWEAERFFKKG